VDKQFLIYTLKKKCYSPWKRKLYIINKKSIKRRKRRIEGIKVRGNKGKRKQKEKSGTTKNEATFQMILCTIFCIIKNHMKKSTFNVHVQYLTTVRICRIRKGRFCSMPGSRYSSS
jgi:hypothetical protein